MFKCNMMIGYNGNTEFDFKCNKVFHLAMDWRCNWKLIRKWLNAIRILYMNLPYALIEIMEIKCDWN